MSVVLRDAILTMVTVRAYKRWPSRPQRASLACRPPSITEASSGDIAGRSGRHKAHQLGDINRLAKRFIDRKRMISWSTLVSLLVLDPVCVGCRHFGGSRRYLACINGPGFRSDPVGSSGSRDIVQSDRFK